MEAARRRQRRQLLLVGVLSAAALIAGAGIASVADSGADWAVVGSLLGLIAAVNGVVLVLAYRRGRHSNSVFAPSPLLALPFRDRRGVIRAIRRGDVVTGAQRDVTISAARHLRRRGATRLFAAAAVLALVNAVLTGPAQPMGFWPAVGGFVCLCAAAVQSVWLRRRAADFLAVNEG
jgi:hypothetical protein